MRDGRQRRPRARALRGAGWVLVALAGVALLVAVGVPLIARGPVLARLVDRATKDRCGSVKLEGGHISLSLVPALIFQRPFDVDLNGVAIREPDGNHLFRARVVRAKLAVLRHPWRVVVDRMLVADGGWSLVDKGLGVPITEALRKASVGGRNQCGEPERPAAGGPQGQGPSLTVREIVLEKLSVVLSFHAWAVALDSLDAHGTLQVRPTADGTQILFDARDIRTKQGGTLRVGPAGARLTPVIPFDHVAIPRVAVTDAAPQDLQLVVAEARTENAVLAGQAVFTNVFAPKPRRTPVGMELDARWSNVGTALARTDAWTDMGDRLAKLRAGLRASLHGPFDALTGSAALSGQGASAHARLLPHGRYALALDFDDFDTSPLVPPQQRALLGGRLDGRVSLNARLSKHAADTEISLNAIELALLRRHSNGADHLPSRWVVSRAVVPRAPNELRAVLGVVALEDQALRVDPFRVDGPTVALAGHLLGEREPGSRSFRLRVWTQPGSRVTWRGEAFLPPPLLDARVDPGRSLGLEPFSVQHVGGGSIDAGGSVRAGGPADLWATIRAYPLAHLPGLAGARAPGGRATIAERLAGTLNASFRVGESARQPSLSGLLALSHVRWARHDLGGGRVVFQGVPDGTRFDGQLLDGIGVRGDVRRHPRAQDFVTLTVGDLPLGPWLPGVAAALGLRASGEVVWRPRGAGSRASTTADLALRGPGIDLNATARLDPARRAARLKGQLALARIQAVLPALRLRRAAGAITADVNLDASPGGETPRIDGEIAIVDRVILWPVGWSTAIVVPPSRVELRGNDVRVANLGAFTSGARGSLAGVLHLDWAAPKASQLAGSVTVSVDGRGLGPWLPGRPHGGSGAANFGARLTGSIGAPSLQGQLRFQGLTLDWAGSPFGAVRVDGPVAIDGRTLAVGPLVARFQGGGWLQIAGPQGSGKLVVGPRRATLPVSEADVTVRGSGLTTMHPIAGLSVRGLALGVRVTKAHENTVRVVGDVNLGHDFFQLKKKSHQGSPARKPARGRDLLDRVWVRLRLLGPNDAVTVGVPYVPDVTVGAWCLIEGPLKSPRVSGQVAGDGLYSRAALAVADWFTSRDLRKCDLAPH